MIRFLSFLLGKEYEPCKSCSVLKQQLAIVNEEKAQLTDTLLNLIKPKTYEQSPTELESIVPKVMTFGRRRAMLEEQDRQRARIIKESSLVSNPDKIEELEKELGVEDAN